VRYTIFDTPILVEPLHWVAVKLLKLFGWRIEGELPEIPKYVLVGAPHTSNWDFVVMLAAAFAYSLSISWMGKKAIFRWPFGALFAWLGGIRIDRSRASGVVAQSIEAFHNSAKLILLITPEGTRKRTEHWKSGFYHIAVGAGVPIVLGFVDYPARTGGFGPTIIPTGDIESDVALMREFYADKTGKYPQQAAQVKAIIVSTSQDSGMPPSHL
jgi:1-acyl-sn-glycerol-3-phosphate acyltransferase